MTESFTKAFYAVYVFLCVYVFVLCNIQFMCILTENSKLASNLASESDYDTSLFIHAATVSARKEYKNDVASVLKESFKIPELPSESRMQIQWQKPTPLSANEALSYLLENTLTKQQYIKISVLLRYNFLTIQYNELNKPSIFASRVFF